MSKLITKIVIDFLVTYSLQEIAELKKELIKMNRVILPNFDFLQIL